jgi:NhaA family Na+:H+ antiporter
MANFFKKFIDDEKSGGLVLIVCTIISLIIANSGFREQYSHFWHTSVGGLSLELWINDALMAIFFLMVGLELKREIQIGEFSNPKNAILPIAAALGGMLVPAGLFLLFNYGTPTFSGIGIPMATDIAFALGILSLLGKRVPFSLKVFLMALAVIDDLGAIIVIAIFYTKDFNFVYLLLALGVYLVLFILNKKKVTSLIPYLIGGAVMWYFMFQSGVHATIAGVLLAFAIPSNGKQDGKGASSYLMHKLHTPVTFLILPIFALANTAVTIAPDLSGLLDEPLTLGISSGLILGKPIGITLACLLVVSLKWAKLPSGTNWTNIIGVGCLGGIGFTMSIFISLLAFDDVDVINSAKFDVLISSLFAGIIGFVYLRLTLKNKVEDNEF